jgi:hypothetical protein
MQRIETTRMYDSSKEDRVWRTQFFLRHWVTPSRHRQTVDETDFALWWQINPGISLDMSFAGQVAAVTIVGDNGQTNVVRADDPLEGTSAWMLEQRSEPVAADRSALRRLPKRSERGQTWIREACASRKPVLPCVEAAR